MNNKVLDYSKRYKSVQKKLSIFLMIFIMLIGVGIITAAILILINNKNGNIGLIAVSIIMILAGIFNIILGYKFNKFSQKNILNMKNEEAARRYMRITGKK